MNPCLDKNWKWTQTNERPMVHYTRKGETLYAISLAWPGKTLKLESPFATAGTEVRMLGYAKRLTWRPGPKGLVIDVPELPVNALPCGNAWVFRLTGLRSPGP